MTFNDITKDTAFYATMPRFLAWLGAFSHERQGLWLPKYDLKDSVASAWSSPHLYSSVTSTMAFYPTTTAGTVHLPQLNLGGARARPGRFSQDGVSQQEETAPLFLPQLNRLHEAYIVRGEDASNAGATIPAQQTLTHQIISLWRD